MQGTEASPRDKDMELRPRDKDTGPSLAEEPVMGDSQEEDMPREVRVIHCKEVKHIHSRMVANTGPWDNLEGDINSRNGDSLEVVGEILRLE